VTLADAQTGLFSLRSAGLIQGFLMQDPNLSQVSLRFFNVMPYGVQLCPDCNLASMIERVHTRLRLRDVGSPLRSSRRLTLILAKAVGRFRLRRLLRCFFCAQASSTVTARIPSGFQPVCAIPI